MELAALPTVFVCALVFLAGLVDAVAGGGGLISLPGYLAAGLPEHPALATNKFSSVLGTLGATIRYVRAGKWQGATAWPAILGALLGSALGARLVLYVPPAGVAVAVLGLIPLALAVFWLKDRLLARVGTPPNARAAALRALWLGLGIGLYDGFFGPGTGTFLTIGYHAALGLDLLVAAGNARIVNLASNLGAVVVFLSNGAVVFPLALYAAAAGIAGNQVGAFLALRRGERLIRPLIAGVLVLLIIEVVRTRL